MLIISINTNLPFFRNNSASITYNAPHYETLC